jgi:hypothetical protein
MHTCPRWSRGWALYQKYARGNCELYDIVVPRVVVEELLRIALWE